MNFQIFKLVLEKAEEPEIKLPTSTVSSKKQESSRKTSVSAFQYQDQFYAISNKVTELRVGKKVMTNLDSIFKSRDISLPTKVRLVKATVFPVVMYGCESWTMKKVEHRRIDAFELWCWRRLLRVPWTPRRSNESILKEIIPGVL